MFTRSLVRAAAMVFGAFAVAGSSIAQTEATLPIECGYSAVTCFSGWNTPFDPFSGINLDAPSAGVIDTRIPGALVPDVGPGPNNWPAAMFHNDFGPPQHRWHARNIGQVFGITLDNASPPNIYVTATTTYGSDNPAYDNIQTTPFATSPFPSTANGGEIYKLDGSNGNVSLFATLPNLGAGGGTGPGLGNICFDAMTARFYVSNFHDGRIYSLDLAGNCKGTLDAAGGTITTNVAGPCPAEPGAAPGFESLGKRPWAVQTHNGRLYFSLWTEDRARAAAGTANTVHSIALTPTGDFTGVSQLEVTVPVLFGDFSNPVSDIAFSSVGRMMLAETVMANDVGPGAQVATASDGHTARNLECELIAGVWTSTAPAREFLIGNPVHLGRNAAGGVAFDCDDNLWSTGDNLVGTPAIYGIQRTPASGNTLATIHPTGYFIDLDGVFTVQSKGRIGDVAHYKCCCMEVVTEELECIAGGNTPGYSWTFCVTNTSGQTVNALSIIPPPGVMLSNPAFAINPPLANGDTRCFTITVSGAPAGIETCFTMILRKTQPGQPSVECCRRDICITPPVCCMEITTQSVTPAPTAADPNRVQVCLNITNLTNAPAFNFHHLFIIDPDLLNPPSFSPQHFTTPSPLPAGGLPPGSSAVVCFFISGGAPGSAVCFDVEVHDIDIDPCCAETVCVDLPPLCPCPDPCPVGAVPENEICGDHRNDVCDPAAPGSQFLTPPVEACGRLFSMGASFDVDHWYINAKVGATYTIGFSSQFTGIVNLYFLSPGETCDVVPPLFSRLVDQCTGSAITFIAPSNGIIVVEVRPILPSDFPCECGGYSMRITEQLAMCLCDNNGDGMITLSDIAAILANWGGPGPAGDCNGDGIVGLADIALVLSQWGWMCR